MHTTPAPSTDTTSTALPACALRIALVQCAAHAHDSAGNLERMRHWAERAQAQGAQVVVFPEMGVTGYNIGAAAVQQGACARDGAYFAAVARICTTLGLAIVFGYPERGADGRVYNAAQWINAQGQSELNYRKTHLYGALDRAQFSAGGVVDGAQGLVTLNGWRIGVLICYDLEFAENTRRLALAGAHAVLVPTANMDRFDFVPRTMVPTRAFENQIAVAYANYCGAEGDIRYGGLSSIVDAAGQTLAQADRQEALLVATLEPAALQQARQWQTHLHDHAQWLQAQNNPPLIG